MRVLVIAALVALSGTAQAQGVQPGVPGAPWPEVDTCREFRSFQPLAKPLRRWGYRVTSCR